MRVASIIGRAIVALVALAVLFINPLYADGPEGRTYLTTGVVIDAIAILILIGVAWSFLRGRTPGPA